MTTPPRTTVTKPPAKAPAVAATAPPLAPATTSADVTAEQSRLAVYQGKTTTPSGQAMDRPELLVLGQICTHLNDDITAISGGRRFDGNGGGGLQQPK
jgi:hypothetical protein